MKRVEVAKSDEVRTGGVRAAVVDGRSILLSRVDGEVCAVENKCPHLGLPLTRGKVVDGSIRCPWHGSRFELCSGRNLDWVNAVAGLPLPQWSRPLVALGKQPAPLQTFETAEEAGCVFVILP